MSAKSQNASNLPASGAPTPANVSSAQGTPLQKQVVEKGKSENVVVKQEKDDKPNATHEKQQ